MTMSSVGLGNKNRYAGDVHQQFSIQPVGNQHFGVEFLSTAI
jgi:hypothetical protein